MRALDFLRDILTDFARSLHDAICSVDHDQRAETITVRPTVRITALCGYGSCDKRPGHDGPHRCRCGRLCDEPANGCAWHEGGTDDALEEAAGD